MGGARGETATSEYKLSLLVPIGVAGAMGAFWLASAVSLNPTETGVTRTAVSFAMVMPLTALLARCGLVGETFDRTNTVFALLVAVGASMATWLAASAEV